MCTNRNPRGELSIVYELDTVWMCFAVPAKSLFGLDIVRVLVADQDQLRAVLLEHLAVLVVHRRRAEGYVHRLVRQDDEVLAVGSAFLARSALTHSSCSANGAAPLFSSTRKCRSL